MAKVAALASLILAVALFVAGMLYGVQREKTNNADRLAAEAKKQAEAYAHRNNTDAKIEGLSGYDLCTRLARVPDECEPLRGVETAPASE